MAGLINFSIKDSLALESINFQSPAFFNDLVNIFTEMKKLKDGELADSDFVNTLQAIVNDYTGMSVSFFIGDIEPSVDIPKVDKNNVLINNFIREYLSSADGISVINEAGGTTKGSVNLVTGKVTGAFTKIKSNINLPKHMFTGTKFSPEEIAAITLHEIGHLVVYYVYITRTVTTNQALAGMSQSLLSANSIEEREAVLITVATAMKLKDLDTKSLAKSTNKKVTEVVVISSIIRQTESELGSNVYDFSTWEYLADQYAARMGAGRHLATSLAKIYSGMWNISFRSTPAYLAWEAVKIVMLFTPLIEIALVLIMMDGSGDGTYDRPGARIKRVRNQIVENLKLKKITEDDRERLNADLKTIDEVLDKINDRRQVFGVIWDTIVPSARKAYNQEKLQKQLENIAANDLFIKASELKQLA